MLPPHATVVLASCHHHPHPPNCHPPASKPMTPCPPLSLGQFGPPSKVGSSHRQFETLTLNSHLAENLARVGEKRIWVKGKIGVRGDLPTFEFDLIIPKIYCTHHTTLHANRSPITCEILISFENVGRLTLLTQI